MKEDKLKELFEANEIKNLHQAKGGEFCTTGGSEDTNNSYTAGDIGRCDTDTSQSVDTIEDDGHGGTHVVHAMGDLPDGP